MERKGEWKIDRRRMERRLEKRFGRRLGRRLERRMERKQERDEKDGKDTITLFIFLIIKSIFLFFLF